MKKFLSAFLFLSTTSILADQSLILSPSRVQGNGPIAIDGLVYSQTYSYAELWNAMSICGGNNKWFCDDLFRLSHPRA